MALDRRPRWEDYFMDIARVVATRSTCLRRQVGALLVRDRRLLTTGYNGAPAKMRHCSETGCLRQERGVPAGTQHELCRGLHAEQNAIIQAALHGVNTAGSVLYVTHQPCVVCAKMLINAGVQSIVHAGDYPDELAQAMLREADVQVRRLELAPGGGE